MEFYSIVTSLPQTWRAALVADEVLNVSLYDKMKQKKNISRQAYLAVNSVELNYTKKLSKLSSDCGRRVTKEEFLTHLKAVYSITNVPKYRSFQYRMLHRAIITNVHLSTWGLRQDNLCSFCEREVETTKHLFATCNEVKNLWRQIFNWVKVTLSLTVEATTENILLCNIKKEQGASVKNFVILIV